MAIETDIKFDPLAWCEKIQMCRLTKTDFDRLIPVLQKRYKTLHGESYLEE